MEHRTRRGIHLGVVIVVTLVLLLWLSYEAYWLFKRRDAILNNPAIEDYSRQEAAFPRRTFGEYRYHVIWVLPTATDEEAREIQSIFSEAMISKSTNPVSKWDRKSSMFYQFPPIVDPLPEFRKT